MTPKERIGWALAILGSILLGGSMQFKNYTLLGLGMVSFASIYFVLPKR